MEKHSDIYERKISVRLDDLEAEAREDQERYLIKYLNSGCDDMLELIDETGLDYFSIIEILQRKMEEVEEYDTCMD